VVRLLHAPLGSLVTHVHLPEVMRSYQFAMRMAARSSGALHAAAPQRRACQHYISQLVARRAVGSTFLLKGLEANVAVMLEPRRLSTNMLR